ncbi:MAG: glycosyltransferase family 4 protein [Acidimicrobiales bacterium]
MNILICNWRDLSHPRGGGAEVYTHEVARRWVASGHQVTIFCAAVAGEAASEERDGVTIVRRGSRYSVYREARLWYESQPPGRFDFIIDQINTRPFFCPDWAGETPVVAFAHQVAREVWFREMPLPIAVAGRWVLEPRWLARYRYVPTLTVSSSTHDSLIEYGMQRVVEIPPAVDDEPISVTYPKESTPTLVFVGRLSSNKRPDHALEALAELRLVRPDAQLWVIGDGPVREELEALDAPGVTFFGRVSHERKFELVARAHALLVTSTREGWGLVVDEAATVGTRSIGYNVAGLRDSIAAADGVLVEPDPVAMATAIDEVIDDWMASPTPQLPRGTGDWDGVASRMLQAAIHMCSLNTRPTEPGRRIAAPLLPAV